MKVCHRPEFQPNTSIIERTKKLHNIIQLSNNIKGPTKFGSHSNNYLNRVKNSSRHMTPVRDVGMNTSFQNQ